MIVVITSPAIGDLRQIGDYLAQESPALAAKIVSGLEQACYSLSGSSERFPLVPELGTGIRKLTHKRYLIFYRVGVTVEIVRVIHGARNYLALFNEDD